jgi:hypothetical protein
MSSGDAEKVLKKTIGSSERFSGRTTAWVSENSDTTWSSSTDYFRVSQFGGFPSFTSDFIVDEVGMFFIVDPSNTDAILSGI